jgi:protein-tyrosine-phosphatase
MAESAAPTAVLFACNFNRVRSPMAAALLRRLLGERVVVDSCGVRRAREILADEQTGAEVDPFAAEVMREAGYDLSGVRVKTFEELQDAAFDLVISFTPEAQHRAVEMARGRTAEIEYWPIPDPTLEEGSRETRLAAYRHVRDALAARIKRRFIG